MKTEKYARLPFLVDAIQVDAYNMKEVAEWCEGTVEHMPKRDGTAVDAFIKVDVHLPLNERQTKAFIGDWVLSATQGFKVYTDKAFKHSFKAVFEPDKDVPAAGESVLEHSNNPQLELDV